MAAKQREWLLKALAHSLIFGIIADFMENVCLFYYISLVQLSSSH